MTGILIRKFGHKDAQKGNNMKTQGREHHMTAQRYRKEGQAMMMTETEVMDYKPRNTKDCCQPPEARKSPGRILPWGLQREHELQTP